MTDTPANKRITAIDALRGLAIVGMILCGSIGWHSGLPAWMFHAQVPPPDYIFNPEVRGITWVDLVFPFFLFSMGAAFPFALNKKIREGMSSRRIVLGLFKRWLVLIAFSIVLGNVRKLNALELSPIYINLIKISVWGALFLSLTRFRQPRLGMTLNILGLLSLGVIGIIVYFLGGDLSKNYNDIIIMVLAYVSLFGGLIWLLTRKSHAARWGAFLTVWLIKAMHSYWPETLSFIPHIPGIGWFFDFVFLQYLMIAIPGSIVGDMILRKKDEAVPPADNKNNIAAIINLVCIVLQLWGLFTRNVMADFALTFAGGTAFVLLTYKKQSLWTDISSLGWALLLTGIIFDPIDGGIRKDHCNISYMFVTSGMAAMTAAALLFYEKAYKIRFRHLSECGRNPMIAYTVTSMVTLPVLSITGAMPLIESLAYGSPAGGLFKGLLITTIMLSITIFFTRKKLFWRS